MQSSVSVMSLQCLVRQCRNLWCNWIKSCKCSMGHLKASPRSKQDNINQERESCATSFLGLFPSLGWVKGPFVTRLEFGVSCTLGTTRGVPQGNNVLCAI